MAFGKAWRDKKAAGPGYEVRFFDDEPFLLVASEEKAKALAEVLNAFEVQQMGCNK